MPPYLWWWNLNKDCEKAKEWTLLPHLPAPQPWLLGGVCCFWFLFNSENWIIITMYLISVNELFLLCFQVLFAIIHVTCEQVGFWLESSFRNCCGGFFPPSQQSLKSIICLDHEYLKCYYSQRAEILAHRILKWPVDVDVLIICCIICKICSILILIQVAQRPVEYEWWQTLFMYCPWMWPGNGLNWSY